MGVISSFDEELLCYQCMQSHQRTGKILGGFEDLEVAGAIMMLNSRLNLDLLPLTWTLGGFANACGIFVQEFCPHF